MRIAFSIYDKAGFTGGPAVNSVRLLPELVRRGHEVVVLGFWVGKIYGHPNFDALADLGIPCRITRRHNYTEDRVKWFSDQVLDVKPDICVANMSSSLAFCAPMLHASGIPVISMCRSTDDLNIKRARFFSSGPLEWRSDSLIAVSDHVLNSLKAVAAPQVPTYIIPPLSIIPQGIADQHTSPVRVIYAGEIKERQKRVGDMLEAWVRVASKHPEVQFTLIGRCMEQDKIHYTERIKTAGLEHRIKILPGKRGREFEAELQRHHISVLMSDLEGFGAAVTDAMANGLVPVCLENGASEHIVDNGRTGFIVKNRQESFEQAMDTLIDNPQLRHSMAVNARESVAKRFSLESVADMWEKCLAETLQRRQMQPSSTGYETISLPRNPDLPGYNRKPNFLEKVVRKVKKITKKKK